MIGIGLDFGTTNSSIALFNGEEISYLKIDPLAQNNYVMPSALYLNREYVSTIGTKAIQQYLAENEGRSIELRKKELGEVKMTFAELGTIHVAVHANVDMEMPGHLFHGLKRWLGDDTLEYVSLWDRDYRSVALITPILEHLRKAGEKGLNSIINSIHIGRPIYFEGQTEDSNKIALKRLREASIHSGFEKISFYPEPLAASLGYLYTHGQNQGNIILTFDFGGGTLDLSLIRIEKKGFKILATNGVPIGGVRIDEDIYVQKLFPLLGNEAMVKSHPLSSTKELPFGFYRFSKDLLNWKSTYRLNTVENIRMIDRGIANSNERDARRLSRLKKLILANISFSVHQAIERAKIDLSGREVTRIDVQEIDMSIEFSREELNKIIMGIWNKIDAEIDVLIEMAGIRPGHVGIVVRTGGSSQIPLVHGMLDSKFPGKVIEFDVFKSIAAGLAIANYHGYEFNLV